MGLKEDIVEEIKKAIEDDKLKQKEKKFKLPFGKKVGKSQRKKNFVTILVLNENNNYEFKKYQIDDQTISHDTILRLATSGHVMYDNKGNPMIILPNWSVEPFSPLEHFQKSLVNGSNTSGYKILMNKMKLSQVDGGKKMGNVWKWIIGIVVGGIIIFSVLSGGNK